MFQNLFFMTGIILIKFRNLLILLAETKTSTGFSVLQGLFWVRDKLAKLVFLRRGFPCVTELYFKPNSWFRKPNMKFTWPAVVRWLWPRRQLLFWSIHRVVCVPAWSLAVCQLFPHAAGHILSRDYDWLSRLVWCNTPTTPTSNAGSLFIFIKYYPLSDCAYANVLLYPGKSGAYRFFPG